MNEKNRKIVESSMELVWESFEWLLKEKLTSIDDITRRMVYELTAAGANQAMIVDYLLKQFELLKRQIVAQQDVYYEKHAKDRGKKEVS